jgi:hypothetical protein
MFVPLSGAGHHATRAAVFKRGRETGAFAHNSEDEIGHPRRPATPEPATAFHTMPKTYLPATDEPAFNSSRRPDPRGRRRAWRRGGL